MARQRSLRPRAALLEEWLRLPGRRIRRQFDELEFLYQNAPIGLSVVDRELRYVRINEWLAAAHGRSVAAHLGLHVRDAIPDIAPQVEPLLRQVLETGEPILDREVAGATDVRPGESRDWLASYYPLCDAAGRPVGVSAVVLEVTERTRAQRALQEAQRQLEARVRERTAALAASELRYRELVETVRDVVFTLDQRGAITYVSPAIGLVAGYTPAELLGRPFSIVLHPDDVAPAQVSFQDSLAGRGGPYEGRLMTRDGRTRWIRTFSSLIERPDGGAELRGVLTDVTERRQAEEDRHARHGELAHVQRVASIGELTAQIAHEINQPLAAIVNFADGLMLRLREPAIDRAAMLDVAAQIAAEGRRAAEVIRRLREFVRKGAVQREPSDVGALVGEVARLCEADAHRLGANIRLEVEAALPPVPLDRVQVQQVLMNLLRNGLDAVAARPDGARLVRVAVSADKAGGARLTVSDTGVGLPPGAEEEIFEPFFTTKRDGLGLGLAISRSIVEAHGGRLWAERAAAGGTHLHVRLPATAPDL